MDAYLKSGHNSLRNLLIHDMKSNETKAYENKIDPLFTVKITTTHMQ